MLGFSIPNFVLFPLEINCPKDLVAHASLPVITSLKAEQEIRCVRFKPSPFDYHQFKIIHPSRSPIGRITSSLGPMGGQ